MRILIVGATGFIGRRLVSAIELQRHLPIAWVRSPVRARRVLGSGPTIVSSADGDAALVSELSRCDAVVNLAGEPIVRRWTPARRAAIVASRVDLTTRLVQACAAASPRPRVLVSGSGVGYYGDRGDEVLTEQSPPGTDFLSQLATDWEAAAMDAVSLGMRVVTVRTGIVLGAGGGALAQMRPAFALGLGGPMGSGRQYLAWIHMEDHVSIVLSALADDRYQGPVNAVGPEAVTNGQFARALGRAMHRPAVVPVPAFALELLFGEASVTMLSSQRARPARLEELGFQFAFPTVASALDDAVRRR